MPEETNKLSLYYKQLPEQPAFADLMLFLERKNNNAKEHYFALDYEDDERGKLHKEIYWRKRIIEEINIRIKNSK